MARETTGVPVWKKFSALFGLVGLCVIMSLISGVFLTTGNILNILSQISVISVIAAGSTFVILTGGIDLSVGSIMGLCGVLSAGVLKSTGSVPAAIAVCLAVGGVIGLINGYFIAYQKIPAFVATLGMMSIARGFCFIYTKGKPISIFPDSFRFFGAGYLGSIPVIAVEVVLVYCLAWFILRQRPFGRYIYSIGSNEDATRLAGINTNFHKMLTYAINGLLCGFAALLFIGRINSGHPLSGNGYELNAIAAVVIGGTSLSGGRGSIIGTAIGSLIMGVISNGLNLMNVDAFWQGVVLGVVIILAVLVDIKSKAGSK
jgi:Ribose/xylose/arabinose/galactoside ABC-type transport systems, permease components